jgi:hypothetical protein
MVNKNVLFTNDDSGLRRMIYVEPKNIAPTTDSDPSLVGVYSHDGILKGKIDPSRYEKMLDQDGNWLASLQPGETAYGSDSKALVVHTKPGDISFTASGETMKLTVRVNGRQTTLRDEDRNYLDGPETSSALYLTNVYDNISGTETKPDQYFVLVHNKFGIDSAEHVKQALLRLGEQKQLPACLVIQNSQRFFGGLERNSGHVINAYDYNPDADRVRYSNQWSRKDDRMGEGVPIDELFQSMKAPEPTPAVGDPSGADPVQPLPPPHWLKLPT